MVLFYFLRMSFCSGSYALTVQRWSSMFFRTRMGFAVGIVCVWCVQGSSCGVGCMSGGPGALYIRMALGNVIR